MSVTFALAAAGCPKQRSTLRPPPQLNPPPPVERSAEVRVDELGERAQQLARTAERLPGRTADEHRALAAQAFADLSQLLPILFGPNVTGVQRQQLRVVENARSQLSARSNLAPEPTIDTGLRAARDALSGLGRGGFYDHPDLARTLDRIDKTVSDLDATRGARHEVAVTDVVTLMSQAVNQMTEALNERLGNGTQAPRQPQ
jgi:hypothetical protein